MFWGCVLKANQSHKLVDSAESDILRLSTAVLGGQEGKLNCSWQKKYEFYTLDNVLSFFSKP